MTKVQFTDAFIGIICFLVGAVWLSGLIHGTSTDPQWYDWPISVALISIGYFDAFLNKRK